MFSKKVILQLFIVIIFNCKADTTFFKINKERRIKIDLVSLYNTSFDVRKQIRIGIEYEHKVKKRLSITYHIDIGLFDSYTYNKYYDFFNTYGGLYNEQTKVNTYGFEFLFGVKYFIKRPESKKVFYFIALNSDINMFKKSIEKYNTKNFTSEKRYDKQLRIGIGPEIGVQLKLYKSILLEVKPAVFFNTLTIKSNSSSPDIKPYKALWYEKNHSFWIVQRLNLCYAF